MFRRGFGVRLTNIGKNMMRNVSWEMSQEPLINAKFRDKLCHNPNGCEHKFSAAKTYSDTPAPKRTGESSLCQDFSAIRPKRISVIPPHPFFQPMPVDSIFVNVNVDRRAGCRLVAGLNQHFGTETVPYLLATITSRFRSADSGMRATGSLQPSSALRQMPSRIVSPVPARPVYRPWSPTSASPTRR